MRKLADFCGVKIMGYCVMNNHYHQFIKVPSKIKIGDDKLMQKIINHYGEGSRQHNQLRDAFKIGGEQKVKIRRRFLQMMGDISIFQKLLKQRFTIWYNAEHNRRGTLWMERFKSVLVENSKKALQYISAYIDLNPVRANLVRDPKDYPFCSYSSALLGNQYYKAALKEIMGVYNWTACLSSYRSMLIIRGNRFVRGKSGKIDRDLLLETLHKQGHLSKAELFQLHVRYLTDGIVLGSEKFVENTYQRFQKHFGKKRESGANPIPGSSLEGLYVINKLRNAPIH